MPKTASLTVAVRLFVGEIRPMPGDGRPTALFKSPVTAPLHLGMTGFAGDQQADRRVHGGPDKAVHLYPLAHYARLAALFPEAAAILAAGSLGENISAAMEECDICLGDVFALGEARLQLAQPRSPCWKIDARCGTEGVAAAIAQHGLTGWYWRVLTTGMVCPEDRLTLLERHSEITLAAAQVTLRAHRPPLDALEGILNAPGVAMNWRDKIAARLAWLREQAGT